MPKVRYSQVWYDLRRTDIKNLVLAQEVLGGHFMPLHKIDVSIAVCAMKCVTEYI
jgi:hypothetical protein